MPVLFRPWPSALLFLAIALVLLGPGSAVLPLMDRDEPRFANATWEMMERGEWLVPYFNDEYRFDKPVLTYWWMRPFYALLGKTELAARLHSILATWLTAVAAAAIGRFLYSPRAGFWAGIAWLTCFQVLVHGRLCVADMPMLFGVTLTMLAAARLLFAEEAPRRWGTWFWVLAAGVAVGFLAKGPVATLTPVLGLLLYRFVFLREPVPWSRLQPIPVLLLATAAVGAWGIPALMKTEGAFWDVGIGTHVVERGVSAFNGRVSVPFVYYLATGFASLAPWSAFVPGALRRAGAGDDPGRRRRAFLLGWFVAPYVIFFAYRTQLPHYVMPGFPAFFLLLFRGGELPALSTKLSRHWFLGVVILFAVLAAAGFVAALVPGWRGELAGMRGLLLSGAALLALLLAAIVAARRARWAVFAGIYGLVAVVAVVASLGIRAMHPVIRMQPHWEARPDVTKFRGCRFTEPSLVFYSPGFWKMGSKHASAFEWMERHEDDGAIVFVLREWTAEDWLEKRFGGEPAPDPATPKIDDRDAVLGGIDPAKWERITVRGFNAARTSWVELLLCVPVRAPDGPGSA